MITFGEGEKLVNVLIHESYDHIMHGHVFGRDKLAVQRVSDEVSEFLGCPSVPPVNWLRAPTV